MDEQRHAQGLFRGLPWYVRQNASMHERLQQSALPPHSANCGCYLIH